MGRFTRTLAIAHMRRGAPTWDASRVFPWERDVEQRENGAQRLTLNA